MARATGETTNFTLRSWLLGSVILATFLICLAFTSSVKSRSLTSEKFSDMIPDHVGDYSYDRRMDVYFPEISDDSVKVYQKYLARTYTSPGKDAVTLLLAYGPVQNYSLQVHRPESCYPAAGFALSDRHVLPLTGDKMKGHEGISLIVSRLDRRDRILYWVRVGDAFPTSLWGQRLSTFKDNLRRIEPDGVLLRLSISDSASAPATLQTFNANLIASLGAPARAILLGVHANGKIPKA